MTATPLTDAQADDIAGRLFAAISENDATAIREIYAPDAVISNNHTPGTTSVDDLVTMIGHMRGVVTSMVFERGRTQATGSGFVDEHITHFTTQGGAVASLPSCMIVDVRDGRIAKVVEYSNPADMAPLMPELMGGHTTDQ